MSIVGRKLTDVRVQRLGRERINARVDFALLGFPAPQCLLLDDALDFVGFTSLLDLAEHAAVTGWVRRLSRENGHCSAVGNVKVSNPRDGLRLDQGNIA